MCIRDRSLSHFTSLVSNILFHIILGVLVSLFFGFSFVIMVFSFSCYKFFIFSWFFNFAAFWGFLHFLGIEVSARV